jgi:hypothetical protein
MGNLASSARVKFEPIRSLGFAAISALTSTAIGSPFSNPVRLLKIDNATDVDLLISFNGIDIHTFLASRTGFVFDYASNKISPVGMFEQAQGERVYVQAVSALPTVNGVYVTVLYASQV